MKDSAAISCVSLQDPDRAWIGNPMMNVYFMDDIRLINEQTLSRFQTLLIKTL